MDFIKTIWSKYGSQIIIGTLLVISLVFLCYSINKCSDYKDLNNHNIVALTDSIKYYKSKTGDLVAEKTLLEGDLSTLKLANEELYNQIKDMKLKDPTVVVHYNTVTEFLPQDTAWEVIRDTITGTVQKDFAFNNEWRTLEGNVTVSDSTLGMNITKDQVFVDYTLAVQNSKVYMTSHNPYVKFTEIQGITIPQPKKKKFSLGIGPQVGYGYNFKGKQFAPYIGIGIGLQWNIIQF